MNAIDSNSLYSISGKVLSGKKRGKDLGFPTANVSLEQEIPEGIYVSEVMFEQDSNLDSRSKNLDSGQARMTKVVGNDRKKYPSVSFIGPAIQFGEDDYKSETYILDFDEDLYGKEISVKLLKKIRDNMKFDSVDELIDQMQKDVEETRKYFLDSRLDRE